MAQRLGRTDSLLEDLGKKVSKIDGIANVIAIDGISLLDNSSNLANGGVLYVMFKDWSVRGKNEDLKALYTKSMNTLAAKTYDARYWSSFRQRFRAWVPRVDSNQLELQDGTFDYRKLQAATDQLFNMANKGPELQRLMTSFRSDCTTIRRPINRTKAESLGVQSVMLRIPCKRILVHPM